MLKGFSKETRKAYLFHSERFLEKIGRGPQEILEEEVKAYIATLSKAFDPRTVNLAIAAIKFFLRANGKDFAISYLKRPKRLPEVLAQEEVARMLEATQNQKHGLVLGLLYGCGLRLSEIRDLKKEAVRPQEGILIVRQGKGNKDRIVSLPSSILRSLQPFLAEDGFPYVFRSERGGRLHRATIQKIVKNASRKADIRKRVHPHTLRHSYATHLLEGGTDLRVIQRLLGHANIQATEIYTHVSTSVIKRVVSPLDTIDSAKAP